MRNELIKIAVWISEKWYWVVAKGLCSSHLASSFWRSWPTSTLSPDSSLVG